MSQVLHTSPIPFRPFGRAPGVEKRDFLSLHDLSVTEMAALLDHAAEVKAHPSAFAGALEGRTAALIFEKPSLRTRVSFEVGLLQLGAHGIYLAPADIGLGKREAVKDVARNLALWVDALVMRTFSQRILEDMALQGRIPVINALSDLLHPCQTVADLLTLRECKGQLQGLRVAFIGDGNNVAHSLAHGAAKVGLHLTIASPPNFEPASTILMQALADANATGATIRVMNDPAEAVRDADAVYTDVWASMGQEQEAEERKIIFAAYQVNASLLALAKPDAVFLHCLPAHRGEEVTTEVLDGPQSVALQQAANRLHAHKAILLSLLAEAPD
ncbi:MAG: ornithine carbamoyltransferase [Acidobacteriia bacterium]|nr:ornithine carbamoyltransferase [Terriglobia bacterium]